MKYTKAITKWLLGAALASAFVFTAPNKAQAQAQVVYDTYPGFRPHARYDGWRRREYFEHQRWEAARWRRDRWERERFHDRGFYRRY